MIRLLKRYRINKKSMLINLIFSYILVLSAALCVYFLTFGISTKVLKKEVENNYRASLSQLKLVVDNRLSDIDNIGTGLYINKKLESLMYKKDSYDSYDAYDMASIITQMQSWKLVNNFIENINVYLPNLNIIISDSSTYDFDCWHNLRYKTIKGMEMEEFKEALRGYHFKEYLPLIKVNRNKTESKILLYVHSLSVNPKKVSKGTLIVSIKEGFIKSLLENYDFLSEAGSAFILDSTGNIVGGEDGFNLSERLSYQESVAREKELINIDISGKRYVILLEKSDVTNWVYGYIMPNSAFLDKLNMLSTISVISIGICLLFATIIIAYFTRKNYTPIEALIKLFSKFDSSNLEEGKDEYKYIQKVANKIINEREEIYNRFDRNKLEFRNGFLLKLLSGRINNEQEFMELCKEHDVKFNNSKFAVIVISPKPNQENNTEKNIFPGKLQFLIKETFEAQSNIRLAGYVVELDQKSACIININSEGLSEAENELCRIASEGQKIVNSRCDSEILVSIGLIHNFFTSIPASLNEAIETLEYQNLIGEVEILDYNTINYPDAFVVEDFENNKKLKSYIENGDFTAARAVLESIFNKNFYNRKNSIPLNEMKTKMYGLINLILESMYDLTAKYDYDFFKNINPENKILKCDNLNKLHKEMESILIYAEDYVKKKEKAKNDNLLDKVIEFIRLNYKDNNLSVSMIADEFGVTVPYLSKFFKKKMDKGLLDYIHSLRIEQAKELLKDKSIQIKDIAEQTGYYNAIAFIRVFKKFEGVPPGKFRE
jgi:YesN/AraC family two-component response regulator